MERSSSDETQGPTPDGKAATAEASAAAASPPAAHTVGPAPQAEAPPAPEPAAPNVEDSGPARAEEPPVAAPPAPLPLEAPPPAAPATTPSARADAPLTDRPEASPAVRAAPVGPPAPEPAIADETGGFTALFVRRPVLALVVNLLIVVAGLAALRGVEIRELPETDSPVVTVSTTYPGAAPETIDREVTARIEGAAGRVAGVRSISSSSSFGQSRVTVEFAESADLDIAASDMRDAVARIARDLPDTIEDPRIVKADANADAVMRLAATSTSLPVDRLTRFVEDELVERLTAVPGVADVQIYGDRQGVFQIDVDPVRLAARGLTVADLATALSSAAFDTPAGSLTSASQDLVVRATASIDTPEEFEALRVNRDTMLGEVAAVTYGPDPGSSLLRANGQTGVGLGIVRQPGSNTLDISEGVRGVVSQMTPLLPEGLSLRVTSDDATFIRGALDEVVNSLALAVAIVVAIIFLFLRSVRATLIPAVTLPVALIGTLAGIWIAGFSINILTLLALVLATGMVVDDAIVVLENIVTRRAQGLGPRAAAVIGTREVFFAVVTTTATLAAVFIPISFLPGKAGALFREFGYVLAISVLLSSVVALTLAPMLASRMLGRPKPERTGIGGPFDWIGAALSGLYRVTLRLALALRGLVVVVSAAIVVLAVYVYQGLDQELTPPEDRAVALLSISAPQGVSLDYTSAQLRRIESLLEPLRATGEIANLFAIAGRGGSANSAFMVATLAPWGDRERSQGEIVGDINGRLAGVPGVRAFAIQPNSLGIRGGGNGLQMAFVGESYEELSEAAQSLKRALEDDGRFGRVRVGYEASQPQLSIAIDRERASDLGIPVEGLAPVLQAMLDGRAVGEVFIADRAVEVKLVSTLDPINDPLDLESVLLRSRDGRSVPLSALATLTERAVAPELAREQKLRSVSITAQLGPDLPLQRAVGEVTRLAEPSLKPGIRLIPLAEAATLAETSQAVGITFGFAIVVVLLVLAAQFESLVSALIIMLTVPLGLACAVFAMALTGTSLNVYSQIGLVLLVGIMAKNGILIVEFANQLRDQGLSVAEAIEQASVRRLRPVMMTMISTVLGGVPLILAHGAGAEARIALGWIIVGGLGLATIATLFLTPALYRMLAGFSKPRASEEARLRTELAAAHAAARHGSAG